MTAADLDSSHFTDPKQMVPRQGRKEIAEARPPWSPQRFLPGQTIFIVDIRMFVPHSFSVFVIPQRTEVVWKARTLPSCSTDRIWLPNSRSRYFYADDQLENIMRNIWPRLIWHNQILSHARPQHLSIRPGTT